MCFTVFFVPINGNIVVRNLHYASFLLFQTIFSAMDVEESRSNDAPVLNGETEKQERMFTLKKWNAVAMWSWDVECDTCAICRVQVMDACLRQESL